VLTTVGEVHALSEAKAAEFVPVRLRAVVTAFSGWRDYYFVQDKSGGIAVNREEHEVLHQGDVVDLEGTSDPGLFRNSVISKRVRVVGHAAMPRVTTSSYSDLDGGGRDGEWVRVQGIVQVATVERIWDKNVLVLRMDLGGGMINVRIFDFSSTDAARLVDAVVEVEGVCGTIFNDKRQYSGLRLFVPRLSDVRVKEPALTNPYDLPVSPIGSLLQFLPNRRGHHRVKIGGIVTYQRDGHSLYIQEGGDGILISLADALMVPVGSRIEALGFPGLNGSAPTLMSAEIRIVGNKGAIQPVSIRGPDFVRNYRDTFLFAPYDGQLVHVQGKVISPLELPNEDAWLLQDGNTHFVVSLWRRPDGKRVDGIANGSVISVTGVMTVTQDSDGHPLSFRVLIRTPEDVAVLSRAPWWTPVRLAIALGVLLTATTAVVLWTVLLRRQVRLQTRLLRDSERRFRTMAEHDALTGLANRAYLHEQLGLAIEQARHKGHSMGLMMLDLDHFKQVNDNMGHQVGDQLLCVIADRIRTSVRRSDIVARMGGDEFVILLTEMRNEAEASLIAAKLVASVAVPAEIGMIEITVSASVGICTFPAGGTSMESLLQHVDEAMYRAKAMGRNNFCVYGCETSGRGVHASTHLEVDV
jgi:diguanylate cyclase (GGDEF)-like protein